ncbi:ABC transporter substrate-binding protein [Marinobacterium sp. D7]|uniref:glycine betaine ABC transporter substrate-binding protein OsmF n=1 Tax=Marinobacterium ramblicola TaxID=2849041 RepID=UPI001C2D3D02|nr:ABC transporter substrate-binding protein [Marinobacterium ramblicola]MBV1786674.1 ABC transporter substrate-binding protein [Marinobacterium ramblicola]
MIRLLVTLCALFTLSVHAAPIVVSSKIDTEGSLLGNMIFQRLQKAGLEVENRVQLGGTPIVRKAITSGEIDIYPEYTGNAAFFFNQPEDPVWKSFQDGYEKAKQLDYDTNKIVWLTPANANNTWALAVRKEIADEAGLKTMTDFGTYVREGGDIKLAASAEFVSSPAVLPAFQQVYDFTLKESQLLVLSGGNTAATIKAAATQTDGTNTAMVYGTDGAISAVGLVVMADDKGVQPVYAPTPIIREEVLKTHPEIDELLKPVFSSLDLETLQSLNARIAIGGENASDVAAGYLEQLGL